MSRVRDLASILTASSVLGTDVEVATAVSNHSAASNPHTEYVQKTLTTTTGDIIYASSAKTPARLGIGSTDQILKVSAGVPTWATPAAAGMTNPMTTTGDTIYSSSSSTPARLGIGTAGQVLAVNSGATAPEWTTVSSGGMTLIGSSSLSGASVTISSIPSTYKHLMILIERAYSVSSDYPMALRFSGDTGSNYNNKTLYGQTEATNSYAFFRNDSVNATSLEIRTRTLTSVTAGKNLNLVLNIYNYASTSPRYLEGSAYSMNSGNEVLTTQTTGTYIGSSAISSVTALIPGTNWSGGTFSVYGVS
jgi:hypothetical protein